MAVYRIDLHVRDPQLVFDWLNAHVPRERRIRCVGYGLGGPEQSDGWLMKVVFKEQADAERCLRHFLPERAHASVPEWDGTSRVVFRRFDA